MTFKLKRCHQLTTVVVRLGQAGMLLAGLASGLAHAHEQDGAAEESANNTFDLSSYVYIDARWLDTDEYTPLLPLAGVNNLPVSSPLFGQSRIGLHGVYHDQHPVDFNLSAAYSDLDQKVMLDHANIGVQFSQVKLTAGRMNPLPHYRLDSWPIADLLTLAIAGSDHWHAEGAMLSHQGNKWRGYAGVFLPSAYPGGTGGGFSHSLYTAGLNWQPYRPLHLKLEGGYLEQVIRPVVAAGTHTHTTDTSSCGTALNCVDAHAGWVTAGLTYSPKWHGWQPKADIYGLWKNEKGNLLASAGNQEYDGDLTGGIVQLSVKPPRLPCKLSARYERLGLSHELTGENASLVAQQSGWLANSLSPYRYGIKLEYAIKPWLIPYIGYIRDNAISTADTREKQEFAFAGIIIDWQKNWLE